MNDFYAAYPEYASTSRLDELRATEYSYLDKEQHVYLDYTGAGLAARSQIQAHAARMRSGCYGNPHSQNPASKASTLLVEETRAAVLRHFNASPDDYAVIFTPNATGACRLIAEAYPFHRLSRLVLTADNHNSVNGIREFASARGARVEYVGLTAPDLRVSETPLFATLAHGHGAQRMHGARPGLFAYPAQSNFSGVRHPLSWVRQTQEAGYDVLLDAAAFAPTSRLDLSVVRPEFVTVSLVQGVRLPNGDRLPAGQARRAGQAAPPVVLRRDDLGRQRAGELAPDARRRERFRGWHAELPHDPRRRRRPRLGQRHRHGPDPQPVNCLTGWLLTCLGQLKHGNGAPMVRLYGPGTLAARGANVTFNFLDPVGQPVDERAVERDASAAGISLRTGCFCNPGAAEWAFRLTKRDVRGAWWAGPLRQGRLPRSISTVGDYLDLIGLPTGGAVRVSLGLASTLDDIESFLDFAECTYRDRRPGLEGLAPRLHC